MVIKKTIRVAEKLYIRALIAGGMSTQMVVDELTRLNLEVPTNEMEAIVNEVRAVEPTLKNFDENTLAMLEITDMYCYRFNHPTPDGVSIEGCEGALQMLEDVQLKKIIIALSLAGINPMDIELLVNGRYHVTHESPDFQAFIKYFANFEDWTYADKEFYIDRLKDAEFKMILKKAALKGDRHYLVWKIGLGADPHMSMEAIFTDMMADAYFTFKDNVKLRPDDAQKFASLAIKLADRLDQADSKKKETHSFADELKIKFVVESTKAADTKITDMKDIGLELPKRGATPINLESLKIE